MATHVATEIVSLPMFPQLGADQLARVAAEVHAYSCEANYRNSVSTEEVLQIVKQ